MAKNPFKEMSDKQLSDIYIDIKKSKEEHKITESLIPYAKDIKDNINGTNESFTLREALVLAKEDFYEEVCERFISKINQKDEFIVEADF